MWAHGVGYQVYGLVSASSPRKQEIGRALAQHLSFVPGPGGGDGSVDGAIMGEGGEFLAHFQSKLSASLLDLNEGKNLHSDLMRLKPRICVYVAGVGYEDSFRRLISDQIPVGMASIHLLTLIDIISRSEKYVLARNELPGHVGGEIDWDIFRV